MNTPSADHSMPDQASGNGKRLSVNERLGLISLIDEGSRIGSPDSPVVADLFSELSQLVDRTVSGSKIDRLKPEESTKGFQVLEINSESGENLARLNVLYLRKPIPCYYLVYVEVAPPFRNKGLGTRILEEFKGFLITKSAVGILDNIIPEEDPTYDIYLKRDWKPIEDVTGTPDEATDGVYMVFVPQALRHRELKQPVRRLLHHLKRKRQAIDMRDNELMVRRTIEEFKELYSALLTYFENGLRSGQATPLMRFMFTRYVTKLLGFRRRIGQLLGYTGGESLQQIVLDEAVRALPVQSYAPRDLATHPSFVTGDRQLWLALPEVLKKRPARMIEALPNYRRPSLVSWMEANGVASSDSLTIGDLMEIGFDPTRLKELELDDTEYIFERVQPRLLPEVEKEKDVLERLATDLRGVRAKHTLLQTNAPLLVIRDRGNCYVLRRKVPGIHWEEAVEQLQTQPGLKELNGSLGIEKMILSTVKRTTDILKSRLPEEHAPLADQLSYFVSWNLDTNQPRISIDFSSSFLECIWIA
jgi:GNAT superfamily N-acetyltransferase